MSRVYSLVPTENSADDAMIDVFALSFGAVQLSGLEDILLGRLAEVYDAP